MAGSRQPGPWAANQAEGVGRAIDPETAARISMPQAGPVTPTATPVHPDIDALDLAPIARAAAYELRRLHPLVHFTSGRRSVSDQARAMASNVASRRRWIEQTYRASTLRDRLQAWVDEHEQSTTAADIAAGLLSVFESASATEVARFSKHLGGEAFDVQPVEPDSDNIKASIRGLAGLELFLESEGGLTRWHVQF